MKFDAQTLLIIALSVGAGYMLFRPAPTQLKDQAAMLKSIAALVAAIAVLKGKLGNLQKKIDGMVGISGPAAAPAGKPLVDVDDEAWDFE